MKPGAVGAVLIVLAGGVAAGALVFRDRTAGAQAREQRALGDDRLRQGDREGARRAYLEACAQAARVGGLGGQRGAALDEADAARAGLRLLDALEAAPSDPLPLLRLAGELRGEAAAVVSQDVLRAGLLIDAARAIEISGAERQAVIAYEAAATAARAAGSPRLEEAERGRRRLVAITSLRDAEEALGSELPARARELAGAARAALEGPGSPFEGEAAERVEALAVRVQAALAHAADLELLASYKAELDRLYAAVDGPKLGELLPEAEALAPPELGGGHPQAAALAERLAALEATRARIVETARAFAGMVLVRRSEDGVALFMDRTEVTNEAFARFVADGGYARPELWSPRGRDRLARNKFRDADRKGPGPSTWRGGPPAGRLQYPVSGIGPEEAEAYAAWAGKRLPTFAEWQAAATTGTLYPWGDTDEEGRANIKGAEREGPAPVGSFPAGKGPSGALDLIGNVREIVIVAGGKEPTFGRAGGAYNTLPDQATTASASDLPEGLRSADTGFRCVKELRWK